MNSYLLLCLISSAKLFSANFNIVEKTSNANGGDDARLRGKRALIQNCCVTLVLEGSIEYWQEKSADFVLLEPVSVNCVWM